MEGMEEKELTAEETQAIRQSAYEGTPDEESAEPVVDNPESVKEPEPKQDDPWAGVPAALRNQIESISGKLSVIDTLGNRLQQAEKRIGGISNDFYNAQKKAQEAPTPEAIEQARKAKEDWEAVVKEFPDLASGIEAKLAERTAKLPDIDMMTNKIAELTNELEALRGRPALTEVDRLEIAFPDFRETVQSNEYKTWLANQTPEMQHLAIHCQTSKDGVKVMRAFHNSMVKTVEKKERLKQSVDLTRGSKPEIDSGEMTEADYRKKLEKELWGK